MKRLSLALMSLTMALCMCLGLAACNTVGKDDNLYITLDTKAVIKEFDVGDEFNCDGLVVTAHYGDENEVVEDYAVKTPDMSTAGVKDVVINYNGAKSQYAITVNKAVEVNGDVAELAAPVVKYVYDSNAVSVKGAKTLDGGALEFTAQAAKGYKLAEITATVGGAEYAVAGGNGEYVIDAEALTDNAIVTIAAEPDDYEIATYKVEYYAQDGKTILAKVGYDSLEERLYQPEAETYYTFNGWYNNGDKVESLSEDLFTEGALKLIGKWSLNTDKVAEVESHLEIYVMKELNNTENNKVTVEIAVNDDNAWWGVLVGELTMHNDEISGLGVTLANKSKVSYSDGDLNDIQSALANLSDIKTAQAEGDLSKARIENPFANTDNTAYLYAYHWGNVYGRLTTYFNITSTNLTSRYFTPWIMINSGDGDAVAYQPKSTTNVDQTSLQQVEAGTPLDVFHYASGNTAFEWSLGTWGESTDIEEGQISYAWEIYTGATLWDNSVDLYIYDATDKDAQTYDFSQDEPFATYSCNGFISGSKIYETIKNTWLELENEARHEEYTFVFAMHLTPNNRAVKLGYVESELNYAGTKYNSETQKCEGTRQTKLIDFVKDDLKLDINLNTDDIGLWWGLGDETSGNIDYKWEVVSHQEDLHDGAFVNVYNAKDIEDINTYDFSNVTPFAYYQITTMGFVSWSKIDAAIKQAWIVSIKGLDETSIADTYNYKFVFAMQVIPNSTGKEHGYIASDLVYARVKNASDRDTKEYTFEKSGVYAPNDAQVGISGNNMEFLVYLNGSNHRGQILREDYNAKSILLNISKEGSSTLELVFVYEEGQLKLYKRDNSNEPIEKDKTFNNANFNNISNSWCSITEFENYIKSAFGLESFNLSDGWELSTKIIVGENCTWPFDGKWSEPVKYSTAG